MRIKTKQLLSSWVNLCLKQGKFIFNKLLHSLYMNMIYTLKDNNKRLLHKAFKILLPEDEEFDLFKGLYN